MAMTKPTASAARCAAKRSGLRTGRNVTMNARWPLVGGAFGSASPSASHASFRHPPSGRAAGGCAAPATVSPLS